VSLLKTHRILLLKFCLFGIVPLLIDVCS